MPKDDLNTTYRDGQIHDRIVMGYIVTLFAAIVAAFIYGYRADLVALFGCAIGGLLHAMIWPSDQ